MRKGLLVLFATGLLISSSPAAYVPDGMSPHPSPITVTNGGVTALALTDAQQAEIRAEEIYRSQVRQELDAKPDETTSRLWTALNSSFVLWLLSSVVLSGIAACYTGWQNRHAKIKENRELIEKLDTEISNRIYEALSATVSYEGSIRNDKFWQPQSYYSLMLNYLNNNFDPATGPDFSIFREFTPCGFRCLVTMLYDALLVNPANKEKVMEFKEVLVIYETFANRGSIPEKHDPLTKESLLQLILEIRETIRTR